MPPMNIRVRDHRQFGRKPTVGIHVLKSLEEHRCDPVEVEQEGEDEGVQGKTELDKGWREGVYKVRRARQRLEGRGGESKVRQS